MALKKSQLYSSLWSSCDELRGGMDASQYKDYVLTLLFMKYVSDTYPSKPDALFEVPEGGSFDDMVALKGDKEIGDKINKIIGRFAEASELQGVIDQADFNDESKLGSGKEMQDRLSKLVAIFDGLDFGANRADGDDLLGDAYEYLMRNFATESGKSKGQFYTPAEVSRVMAQVVGIGPDTMQYQSIYDPTCGSGSLLLKAAAQAPRGLTIYGQEMDVATWALARMNMILHGYETHEIRRGNTLASPQFKEGGNLKRFDFAVANPPFSSKAWSSGLDPHNDEFDRFHFGVPPTKNGDFAFLEHLIASLKSTGKGAIILPHGVLFRGNKEADIRRQLIKHGVIKGIIGLPANLFYGTGIPACIIVVDKELAAERDGVFVIDASRGYIKDGNKNRLRERDIHKIVDVFNRQAELPRYSRMVPISEIADSANDFNLNIPRYIDASEPDDLHDLAAHLNGGIPSRDIEALEAFWEVFPSLRDALFVESDRPGYSEPCVAAKDVGEFILGHPDFDAYQRRITATMDDWLAAQEPALKSIGAGDPPKALVFSLSEDLLQRFTNVPLIDRYDVYQCLMDYWADVMQDDVYAIAAEGWIEPARPRALSRQNNLAKETPDLTIKRKKYKMDLISPALIVARYFGDEQCAVKDLQMKHQAAMREREAFIEENTGEDGLLEDATNDKGRVTRAAVADRLRALMNDADSGEEAGVLRHCLDLLDAEASRGRAAKQAQEALDEKVLARYALLSEGEIKAIVVEDKWGASIRARVHAEVQQVTGYLAARVKELENRYAQTLPQLEQALAASSAAVNRHLKKLGLSWEQPEC